MSGQTFLALKITVKEFQTYQSRLFPTFFGLGLLGLESFVSYSKFCRLAENDGKMSRVLVELELSH